MADDPDPSQTWDPPYRMSEAQAFRLKAHVWLTPRDDWVRFAAQEMVQEKERGGID